MTCFPGSFWFLVFGVNLDIQREGHRPREVAFHHPVASGIFACSSMFTFCFHVQLAAEQH
jgi:hypothetical protein